MSCVSVRMKRRRMPELSEEAVERLAEELYQAASDEIPPFYENSWRRFALKKIARHGLSILAPCVEALEWYAKNLSPMRTGGTVHISCSVAEKALSTLKKAGLVE